jgi:hypothetical protein
MTDIESQLGKKSFPSNPGQNRVLTVDDPTAAPAPQRQPLRELTPEEVAEVERARAEAQRERNVVSKTVRERIEFLAGIGRIKTDFKMDGVTFHLQSLKDGELEDILDVMIAMGETNEAKFNFEIRRQTMARSLASIDGMSVEELIGSDAIESKLELIKSLDENLIDYMHKHYEEHVLKVSREKYAIKTQEDVEEVVEAVKK